jgi:hypothetical protein
MDPLSISTSIIALLQASNYIISLCYDFRAAVKQVPWSLTLVIDEVKDLRNVLEAIESLVSRADEVRLFETRPALRLLQDSNKQGPLANCLRELSILHEKVSACCGTGQPASTRRLFTDTVKWRLKEREAKLCMERIERSKSTLKLVLTTEEM